MKSLVFSLLLILGLSNLSAQAWEILNYELKVAKEGEQISVSFIDERNSLQLKGDTAFIDEDSGFLFYRNNKLYGIIDPEELVLLQEASLLSLQTLYDVFIVEDEDGFYLCEQDFPLVRSTDYFETVELYKENYEQGFLYSILVVEYKGKFGVIVPEIDYFSYILEPKYDEILTQIKTTEYFEFLVRKGDKWGVGNEEGIVIPLKYDELEYIGGEWGVSTYIAWKGGKCGLATLYHSKPVVEIKYTYLSYLKKDYQTFLFLFIDEELVGMRASNGYEEWDYYYEPVMIAHFGSNGKFLLIYKEESELLSFEITDDEIQRLGLASMDWIYFEN